MKLNKLQMRLVWLTLVAALLNMNADVSKAAMGDPEKETKKDNKGQQFTVEKIPTGATDYAFALLYAKGTSKTIDKSSISVDKEKLIEKKKYTNLGYKFGWDRYIVVGPLNALESKLKEITKLKDLDQDFKYGYYNLGGFTTKIYISHDAKASNRLTVTPRAISDRATFASMKKEVLDTLRSIKANLPREARARVDQLIAKAERAQKPNDLSALTEEAQQDRSFGAKVQEKFASLRKKFTDWMQGSKKSSSEIEVTSFAGQ